MRVRAVIRRRAVPTPRGRILLLGLSLAVRVVVRTASRASDGRLPVAMRWTRMERLWMWRGKCERGCQCSLREASGPLARRGARVLRALRRSVSSWEGCRLLCGGKDVDVVGGVVVEVGDVGGSGVVGGELAW